ncbi:hypothetical protein C8Q80DRAFT_1120486 [Daedaleopsis nitida]|nr:hypothetical protein C8Q80DRAFT_1120486 [Daedaleopsis nitida]
MPRRSPPTPLRLHNGPLLPRGMPRHTLPSLPRPAFQCPIPTVNAGPIPRTRMTHTELPVLDIPNIAAPSALEPSVSWSGPSSPTSASSMSSTRSKRSKEFVKGPWDHSGTIQVPIDVGAMLPPPMPAAINARGEGEGVAGRRWGA